MRDIVNNLGPAAALAPAARTASANGSGIDLRGFGSAMVLFQAGAITDGTHTPSVEESDDNVTFSAVSGADLEGTLAAMSANTVQKVGYRGGKRYIRAVMAVTGATTGGLTAATVVRGHPAIAPVA